MDNIYQKLREYADSGYYGFHMPGHKRNTRLLENELPYQIDITEIEGFDDLHHASGILKKAQERAARIYGASETHFLVNGSTVGILSAILGNTKKGDTVLVGRNCHRSVYHAIYMNELKPVYLYPGFCEDMQLNMEVTVSAVKAALKAHSDISAAVIVSPTYDGIISDVKGIADAVHEHGIPLIVDEAHGAHFGFHPYFPQNSNGMGADVVIHSLHKTLPALTQTALLHVNGKLADRGEIRRYLDMLQSSSPSYVLMAGIDECIRGLSEKREVLFDCYVKGLSAMQGELLTMKRLRLFDSERMDRSKIIISVKDSDLTSGKLYRILLETYHLQMEMAAGAYVLGMTSVGDTKEGLRRLTEALLEIDDSIDRRMCAASDVDNVKDRKLPGNFRLPRLLQVYGSYEAEALAAEKESGGGNVGKAVWVPLRESEGCIAVEYAYLYPPGIPLVVPGEQLTGEAVTALCGYTKLGFAVEGLLREGYIKVLKC